MMTSPQIDRPALIAPDVHWVGTYNKHERLQHHTYLIRYKETSVLIDPGTTLSVDHLLENIRTLVTPKSIKYIVLHYYDPSLMTAVARLQQEIGRNDLTIVTHSLLAPSLKFCGIKADFYEIDKHDFTLDVDIALRLKFILTPYCYAPASFVTYYVNRRILFSGDLFGAFNCHDRHYTPEACLDNILAYHQIYMPNRDILNHALTRIERLDLDLIAPQHGTVLYASDIPSVIAHLKVLECGLDTVQTYRDRFTRASEKFLKEKLKNEVILEASPNAVIAINERQEVILFNKRAETMFGFDRIEMMGKPSLHRIIPDAYIKAHQEALERFLSCPECTKSLPTVLELEAKRKNGEHFPIRINFGVEKNDAFTIIVATIQDISEEKLQKEIAQRHMHMAQMGEMLGMIAHQWKQPLSAIAMSNHVLSRKAQNDTIDAQTVLHFTNKIASYTDFLTHTIEDFRKFFKPDNLPAPTNAKKILSIVLAIISPQLQNRNIALHIEGEEEIPFVSYGGELKQVLLNLIKNAVDALEERIVDHPTISVVYEHKEELHRFIVEDNAGGIDEEIKDKIFDIFFTTKDEKRGTGMGLYMSKVIVEEHCKGTLDVENTEKGARFTITVPSLKREDAHLTKATSPTQARES